MFQLRVSPVVVRKHLMLCPASCLPLLGELAPWRCLLGWPRPRELAASGTDGLTGNTSQQEVKGQSRRPLGRSKPLLGGQVSSALHFQAPPAGVHENEGSC